MINLRRTAQFPALSGPFRPGTFRELGTLVLPFGPSGRERKSKSRLWVVLSSAVFGLVLACSPGPNAISADNVFDKTPPTSAGGIANEQSAESDAGAKDSGPPKNHDDTIAFRDIFSANALAAGMSAADVSRLIFLPPTALTEGADQSSIGSIDSAFFNTKPSQLYDLGRSTPINALPNASMRRSLRSPSRSSFSLASSWEFIGQRPVSGKSSTWTSSSFATTFRSAMKAAVAGTSAAADTAYSLNDLTNLDLFSPTS